jgi:hypothetical protein
MAKYFKLSEFACKCGCGLSNIDPILVTMLDEAREIAGFPFVINSGCRCASHNAIIGSSITSSHIAGVAADIKCLNSHTRYKLIAALQTAGFTRFGIAATFIHTDIDKTKPGCIIYLY